MPSLPATYGERANIALPDTPYSVNMTSPRTDFKIFAPLTALTVQSARMPFKVFMYCVIVLSWTSDGYKGVSLCPNAHASAYDEPSVLNCFCAFPPTHNTTLPAVILLPSDKVSVKPFSMPTTFVESIISALPLSFLIRQSVSEEACLPAG